MIGDKIKNLRKRLGLSQKGFGELFGLSKMAICHYENGRYFPSRPVANRMVSVLKDKGIDITLEYLLTEEDFIY